MLMNLHTSIRQSYKELNIDGSGDARAGINNFSAYQFAPRCSIKNVDIYLIALGVSALLNSKYAHTCSPLF